MDDDTADHVATLITPKAKITAKMSQLRQVSAVPPHAAIDSAAHVDRTRDVPSVDLQDSTQTKHILCRQNRVPLPMSLTLSVSLNCPRSQEDEPPTADSHQCSLEHKKSNDRPALVGASNSQR